MVPGELAAVRAGNGMMKSSLSALSSDWGCIMTETCSSTVSGRVLDTLNYIFLNFCSLTFKGIQKSPGTRYAL